MQFKLSDDIKDFLKKESASGILLMIATALALIFANTPLVGLYDLFLSVPVGVKVGALEIDKPLLLWINDGLMAVFFLLIGLEVKREFIAGELASPAKIALPAVAALGGMVVPALVYCWFNWGDNTALQGWAIPTATDIAFALGILALLGNRVPPSLKVFLMALAIIDDLGAIIIIALFYTEGLSVMSASLAGICFLILVTLNRLKVSRITPYIVVGIIMWICVLKSGVHATLAGVLLAFTLPMECQKRPGHSPLKTVEHELHHWVAYAILPIFAFANAGVGLSLTDVQQMGDPVPLGVIAGLFVGKQVGVFLFSALAIKLGLGKLPTHASWLQLYAVAVLCGVGFTMSLFIGTLAFQHAGPDYLTTDRIGILMGSVVSAVWGYVIFRFLAKSNVPASQPSVN
ncbi:Na+/H+ antiporter NhaA [Endozoicomonas sp. SM1973]|uniref:Na(+)/H(+) antiporter NhaA n=1 Tax=Spartinivicinus marinus TaxID=2994442 RepID=A0A853I9I7_9GAMM|nr:Na+/H+ antiporter NhaA [Spartinivicinus marinus]MCX4028107.1 Na+/H+ antiporter NhaA [Spartinivicinus marinus]NYZ66217.1 Na+/H+ antiporter NhaA [Spartinivicinus marinus]